MPRLVAPEILDTLPPEDAAARHSRRDLRRINGWMRNPAWFRAQLARRLRPGERVVELGAGDGGLRRVAPPGVAWDAVDLAPPPAGWPAEARWHRGDLRQFAHWADYPVVVGNLIFHHLDAAELAALGTALRRHARLLLASEPSRSWRSRAGFALLCPLLGAHAVTRHDGRVSIAAGFRGEELAQALGLTAAGWRCHSSSSPLGAHRLIAERPA